jgi:hypothetical protein
METREKIIERGGKLIRQTFLVHLDWSVQDGKKGIGEELVLLHEEEAENGNKYRPKG